MNSSEQIDESRLSQSIGRNGRREPKGKKTIWQILLYVLVLAIVLAAVYLQYPLKDLERHLGEVLGTIAGILLVYGVPMLAITLLWGTGIIRKFFKNTYSGLKLGLGLFGVFTVLGTVLAVVILVILLAFNPSTTNLLNKPNPVLNVSPGFAWVMVGVSLLVTGPAEEYIFRGFVFGGLLDIFKKSHWLILAFVSSLLFAAAHLYYAFTYGPASLIQFTEIVTFGMAMAGTYYLSGGNLFGIALIHGAYDATAFVGVATSTSVGLGLRAFMILLGIIVAFLLYVQRENRKNHVPSNVPQENTKAAVSSAGLIRSTTTSGNCKNSIKVSC